MGVNTTQNSGWGGVPQYTGYTGAAARVGPPHTAQLNEGSKFYNPSNMTIEVMKDYTMKQVVSELNTTIPKNKVFWNRPAKVTIVLSRREYIGSHGDKKSGGTTVAKLFYSSAISKDENVKVYEKEFPWEQYYKASSDFISGLEKAAKGNKAVCLLMAKKPMTRLQMYIVAFKLFNKNCEIVIQSDEFSYELFKSVEILVPTNGRTDGKHIQTKKEWLLLGKFIYGSSVEKMKEHNKEMLALTNYKAGFDDIDECYKQYDENHLTQAELRKSNNETDDIFNDNSFTELVTI